MGWRGAWSDKEKQDLISMARMGLKPAEVAKSLNRTLLDVEEMGQRFRFWIPSTRRADVAKKAAPRQNPPLGPPIGVEHELSLQAIAERNDRAYVAALLEAGGFWWNEVIGGQHVIWHGPQGQKLTPAGYARQMAIERVRA